MSVRAISQVLEYSAHAGTELLMLVVLADYSDDAGNSYPAVSSLARRCRMSPRNANYILSALQASGELRVLKNDGPRGTNRYRIMLDQLGRQPLKPASPLKTIAPLKAASPPTPEGGCTPEALFTLKPTSATPEAGFPKPLKPTSDEPSLNRQEPSLVSSATPTGKRRTLPACPINDIVALYHDKLPDLPQAKVMTPKRETGIRKRWAWVLIERLLKDRAVSPTPEAALDWFGRFFTRAASNDFVMGRTHRSAEHANWRADLDYLMSDKGLTQVVEKTEVTA